MTKEKEKICSKCGINYPNDKIHFRSAKTCKDGLSNVCRICFQNHIRKWKVNSGIIDPSHVFAPYQFGKVSKFNLISTKRNGLYSQEIIRTAKIFRSGILIRSKENNLMCDKDILTIDYFCQLLILTNFKCECCKIDLNLSAKTKHNVQNNSPTIDKLIPELGYVVNNISILCWKCNAIKKDALLTELKNLLSWRIKNEQF